MSDINEELWIDSILDLSPDCEKYLLEQAHDMIGDMGFFHESQPEATMTSEQNHQYDCEQQQEQPSNESAAAMDQNASANGFLYWNKPISKQFNFEFASNFGRAATYIKTIDNEMPIICFKPTNVISKEIYLQIDLYEKIENFYQFAPHMIAQTKADLTVHSKFEKFQPSNSGIFQHTLTKYYVVENKKDPIWAVTQKTNLFNEKCPQRKIECRRTPIIYRPIVLGCQVFEKIDEHYSPLTSRIYSDAMFAENLLKIVSITPDCVNNCDNGTTLTIEIKKWQPLENLKILVGCEEQKVKHGAWYEVCDLIAPGPENETNKLRFTAPICNAEIMDSTIQHVNCYLRLIKTLDQNENDFVYCSKSKSIQYEIRQRRIIKRQHSIAQLFNDVEAPSMPKMAYQCFDSRLRVLPAIRPVNESTIAMRLLDSALNRLKKLLSDKNLEETFLQLNDVYALQNDNENSIIHDTIAHDKFTDFQTIIKNEKLRKLLPCLQNKFGDTPLHYACKLRQGLYVLALARNPIHAIYIQNERKQTPFHVAIDDAPICLDCFEALMLNENYASGELHAALRWALQVYDKNGYTFLHLAVLKQRLKFVAATLKYCQQQGIDACEFLTQHNEETILDLASEQPKMLALIAPYISNPVQPFEDDKNLEDHFEQLSLKEEQ